MATCLEPVEVSSTASNCTGKAGILEINGLVYLIVGSDPVYGTTQDRLLHMYLCVTVCATYLFYIYLG